MSFKNYGTPEQYWRWTTPRWSTKSRERLAIFVFSLARLLKEVEAKVQSRNLLKQVSDVRPVAGPGPKRLSSSRPPWTVRFVLEQVTRIRLTTTEVSMTGVP